MQNKLVLFDIDHTIFNATLYRNNLYANLAKEIGSDVKKFSETATKKYEQLRKTTYFFTPDLFLKTILAQSEKATDLKKIEAVFWNKELYESCVYPDVKKVFADLVKKGIQIGIFSTGDLAHQKIKIESLKEYLSENHIYISQDKFKIIKGTLDGYKKYQIYLIDDYPQILESAKMHNKNVFTVFIKREESYRGLLIPDNFEPDATINNLDQLTDIIRTEK